MTADFINGLTKMMIQLAEIMATMKETRFIISEMILVAKGLISCCIGFIIDPFHPVTIIR